MTAASGPLPAAEPSPAERGLADCASSESVLAAFAIADPLAPKAASASAALSLKDRVEQLERQILRETLKRYGWNKTRAAQALGLSRVGLNNKLERYQLEPPAT